jgi:hypothetical protein
MAQKTISITCIDTFSYDKSIFAIKKTIEKLKDITNLTCVYWFSDIDIPEKLEIPVKWIKIDKLSEDFNDKYSEITLKLCPKHCVEDYNLIVQYDGFAVNSDAWTNEFLNYDYIGAVWRDGVVGNGGFSLRSKKLYEALIELNPETSSDLIDKTFNNFVLKADNPNKKYVPEDVIICRILKDKLIQDYNIIFAPSGVASRFSVEYSNSKVPKHWLGKSLGFHGKDGIAKHYGFDV